MLANHSIRPACFSRLSISRTTQILKSGSRIIDFLAESDRILRSRRLVPGIHVRSIIHRRHLQPAQCPSPINMRIATLQFAPQLGDVEGNIRRANELLRLGSSDNSNGNDIQSSGPGIEELRPDILVLPEMAFSGRIALEKSRVI